MNGGASAMYCGKRLSTPEERVAQATAQAEVEKSRAEAEKSRAEQEKLRADRLADKLRELGIDPESI